MHSLPESAVKKLFMDYNLLQSMLQKNPNDKHIPLIVDEIITKNIVDKDLLILLLHSCVRTKHENTHKLVAHMLRQKVFNIKFIYNLVRLLT